MFGKDYIQNNKKIVISGKIWSTFFEIRNFIEEYFKIVARIVKAKGMEKMNQIINEHICINNSMYEKCLNAGKYRFGFEKG